MCGIIGIVSRPRTRAVPTAAEILALLDAAVSAGSDPERVAAPLADADHLLRGDAGIELTAGNMSLAADIVSRLDRIDALMDTVEASLDSMHGPAAALDAAASRVSAVRDASWSIRRDRLRTADAVHALAGRGTAPGMLHAYLSVQQALSAIDRMEVRGRDSAGLSVIVWGANLSTVMSQWSGQITARSGDPLFTNNSVRSAAGNLVFVYKAAAEIGELGDNTRNMRAAIAADDILRAAVAVPGARVTVLGHTRWASVGIISEPNAHPVNGEEVGGANPYVSVAVLNGDVDNHVDLRTRHNLRFADPITTDAKVIPALVDRHRANGLATADAFRATVSEFEGSVAIGYCAADDPAQLHVALFGSGQGCYVGIAEDRFVVASEPYGVVEETVSFVRLDGEAAVDPSNPGSRGQVAVLDADAAGSLAGITMRGYDGSAVTMTESLVQTAEV
ncbi:MAG: hypothetical protein RLZZ544_25, partial [Actinomycetota bacterium]